MKLSICTDVMGDLSFTDMLDKCVALGVEGVEMTGGGWSKGPHFRADQLLADKGLLKTKMKEIETRGLKIAALNCSANPLDPGAMGERHRKEMEQTIRLAGEIGVKKIVTMSGLPPPLRETPFRTGSSTRRAGPTRCPSAIATSGRIAPSPSGIVS